MRVIEQKIIDCMKKGVIGVHQLSVRDRVEVTEEGIHVYLWNTCIFKALEAGRFYYFSAAAADTPYCMSYTTASRISAIQSHYGDTQVRRKDSRIRSWKDGSQLETGVWYKADDDSPSGYVIHMPV